MKKYAKIIQSKKYKKGKDLCGYKPIYILDNAKKIKAKKWDETTLKLDPKGFFLIRLNKGKIEAGLVNKKNEMTHIIEGRNSIDIMNEIIKKKLISRLDHAAYMGRQLARAEFCLKHKKKFIQ